MSEENKTPNSEQESQILDFEKAQNMTVGEAVRKEKEIKAGITEDDSVLDKYIKQHREEVASQKFETKLSDFENLDTGSLDDFIKKQREELSRSGLVDETEDLEQTVKETVPEQEVSQLRVDTTQTIAGGLNVKEKEETSRTTSFLEEDRDLFWEEEDSVQKVPFYQSKGAIVGALLAMVLAIFGSVYGLNYLNKQATKPLSSSSSSKSTLTTSASSKSKAKLASEDFYKKYAAFFTDDAQTKVKNSELANLPSLEELLKRLEKTAYYDKAKEKYDSLKRQITAIQAVNDKFNSAAIVDGNKTATTVKEKANFDDLSSQTLNTGNANLDTVLQSVIADGRKQLSSVASAPVSQGEAVPTPAAPAQKTVAGKGVPSASAVTSYGITNYNPAILQRDRSRVPYNDAVIADVNNPSWLFNSGILEKIIAVAQERGHISGNNFILERVNIINGNGYYNMFKPDGTYLFSINCKTGYFVGNAPGHADALDY